MNDNVKQTTIKMLIGMGFAGLILLTACSGSATPELTELPDVIKTQSQQIPTTQAPTVTSTESPIVAEELYPAPLLEPSDSDLMLDEGYPMPEYEIPTQESSASGYPVLDQGYPPPLKMELQATIPSTVSLESGDIQLVEFFAFW